MIDWIAYEAGEFSIMTVGVMPRPIEEMTIQEMVKAAEEVYLLCGRQRVRVDPA